MHSFVVIATPSIASKLLKKGSKDLPIDQMPLMNIFLDKLDLLQALDFGDEIIEIASLLKLQSADNSEQEEEQKIQTSSKPSKIVFSTGSKDEKDSLGEDEYE